MVKVQPLLVLGYGEAARMSFMLGHVYSDISVLETILMTSCRLCHSSLSFMNVIVWHIGSLIHGMSKYRIVNFNNNSYNKNKCESNGGVGGTELTFQFVL